ncbi:MAG: DUF7385 family protein [Halodesulfurarchaeum sp.]
MEELDVTDGFSVHDYRRGLKLLEQGRSTMLLANRAPYACPVCGEPFDRLLVTERDAHSVSSAPDGPLCLARTDGQLLILTH